jgi:preprotein translocase SecF subunit
VVVKPRETEDPTLKTYDLWMRSENKEGKQVEQSHDLVRTDLAKFLGGDGLRNSLVSQGVSKDAALDVSLSMPFPSVDVIGSSVAERLRNDALIALVLSLLGIIVYIALRFSSRSMGLSAVLCLFHDVAFTLGFVAVANVFGIVNAKISLPMVAAFLTLVGYSVNDTVVIFDRIRENRGKKRVITPAMIDLSINQTLSRTIKTSATFLLAAVALFVLNLGQRNVLEGFSFILILGSIIGTYSTIAIASPLLLFLPWLGVRIRAYRPRGAIVTRPAARWYALPILPLLALAWLLWTIAYGAGAFVVGLILFPVWTMVEKVGDERETVEEGSAIPA